MSFRKWFNRRGVLVLIGMAIFVVPFFVFAESEGDVESVQDVVTVEGVVNVQNEGLAELVDTDINVNDNNERVQDVGNGENVVDEGNEEAAVQNEESINTIDTTSEADMSDEGSAQESEEEDINDENDALQSGEEEDASTKLTNTLLVTAPHTASNDIVIKLAEVETDHAEGTPLSKEEAIALLLDVTTTEETLEVEEAVTDAVIAEVVAEVVTNDGDGEVIEQLSHGDIDEITETLEKEHDIARTELKPLALDDAPSQPPLLSVTATTPVGETIAIPDEAIRFQAGSVVMVIEPLRTFTPGLYTVTVTLYNPLTGVTEDLVQDLAWGVLAMNFDQDVYAVGETADIDLGILDDAGMPLCGAEATLSIIDPQGDTHYADVVDTGVCDTFAIGNTTPDYTASYTFAEAGDYEFTLAVDNGNGFKQVTTAVSVSEEQPDVVISRASATRNYPVGPTPMTMEVAFSADFVGDIIDVVPASFDIAPQDGTAPFDVEEHGDVQHIIWRDVESSEGDALAFTYTFDAPNTSPEFYTVGPLQLIPQDAVAVDDTMHEQRIWQVANDAVSTWDFSTGGDYTVSNAAEAEVAGGLGQLVEGQTLSHEGSITDTPATALSFPFEVDVVGNYAYVADAGDDGVEVLDISDPANPTHVGVIFDNATTELDGAGSIQVVGNYAYVSALNDNGVEILDISDPTNPTHVGAITDNPTRALDNAHTIRVSGNYAYVTALDEDGVGILDISDPTNPTHVGAIFDNATTALSNPRGIAISGNYAYVAGYLDNGVEVLDISDPTNPTHAGVIFDNATTALGRPVHIEISGNYAYVTSSSEHGVQVLDISDPTNPTHAGVIFDDATTALRSAWGIKVVGNYAYVVGRSTDIGVEVLDISDPTNPTHVTAFFDDATSILANPFGIDVEGNYIYVTSGGDSGIEVLEITFTYPATSPTITPNTGYAYTNALTGFTETLGAGNAGTVTYQISNDNGTTWYYHNGTSWVTATGVAQSNSATDVNTNIGTFHTDVGTGTFKWQAFLTSDGSQQVEIDAISVTESEPAVLVEFSTAVAEDQEDDGKKIPVLLINGTLSTATTVQVTVTGGDADEGDDFENTATVTIPAGTYDGTTATAVAIDLEIEEDFEFEDDETIELTLASSTGDLVLGDASGDGTAQTTHTYTIENDDAELQEPEDVALSCSAGDGVLTWSDESEDEEGYEVFRRINGSGWSMVAELDEDAEEYTDSSVVAGNTYDYRVRSFFETEESDYSDVVSCTILVVITEVPVTPILVPSIASSSAGSDSTVNDSSDPSTDDGNAVNRDDVVLGNPATDDTDSDGRSIEGAHDDTAVTKDGLATCASWPWWVWAVLCVALLLILLAVRMVSIHMVAAIIVVLLWFFFDSCWEYWWVPVIAILATLLRWAVTVFWPERQ